MTLPSSFASLLALPSSKPSGLRAISGVRRLQTVFEAVHAWPSGPSVESPIFHTVFRHGPYEVCLAKPGKETTRPGDKHNPNDMWPCVRMNEEVIPYVATFDDIFEELSRLNDIGKEVLEFVTCLLIRCVYMLDHTERASGVWRYSPPAEVISHIEGLAGADAAAEAVPLRVFLHFADALAWNEDVKYDTLGYDVTAGYGRENNLLTYAHVAAVLMKRAAFTKFIGSFARPPAGVAPLSLKRALEVFPMLAGS